MGIVSILTKFIGYILNVSRGRIDQNLDWLKIGNGCLPLLNSSSVQFDHKFNLEWVDRNGFVKRWTCSNLSLDWSVMQVSYLHHSLYWKLFHFVIEIKGSDHFFITDLIANIMTLINFARLCNKKNT